MKHILHITTLLILAYCLINGFLFLGYSISTLNPKMLLMPAIYFTLAYIVTHSIEIADKIL